MAQHEKFRYKSSSELISNLQSLGLSLPWSDKVDPLLKPSVIRGIKIPNRLVVQPMEGFDSGEDGSPGELAFRRYGRYAAGGSGMIWFEATSVTPDGRSNPHQMMITPENVHQYKKLNDHIRKTAAEAFGRDHKPFLVLQLTHSGRYGNPGGESRAKGFSENPFLDDRRPMTDDRCSPMLLTNSALQGGDQITDSQLDAIKSAFTRAVDMAEEAGFDAVDIKACHGYLLHEMLLAYDRTDSRYGGSFVNRTRFLREVLNHPTRIVKAFRLSAFDMIPHPYGFGMKPDGSMEIDLAEVKRLINEFSSLVPLWNITAGIPRLATHIGRPYDRGTYNAAPPDEHPLEGIERLIRITGELQRSFPDLFFVGTGYSWLRQFYPHIGAGVLLDGLASFIGLGRSSFAYPDSPADLMRSGRLDPKKTCVTCSKCTELMREGGPVGCAVRDEQYKGRRQRAEGKN